MSRTLYQVFDADTGDESEGMLASVDVTAMSGTELAQVLADLKTTHVKAIYKEHTCRHDEGKPCEAKGV